MKTPGTYTEIDGPTITIWTVEKAKIVAAQTRATLTRIF